MIRNETSQTILWQQPDINAPVLVGDPGPSSSEIADKVQMLDFGESQEIAKLKRQLEQRDDTISLQAAAIKQLTADNAEANAKIKRKKDKLSEKNENFSNLETDLFKYEAELNKLRPLQKETQAKAVSPGLLSSVGKFCLKYSSIFEAICNFSGAILSFCYSSIGAPIAMCVTGCVKIFNWFAGFFS